MVFLLLISATSAYLLPLCLVDRTYALHPVEVYLFRTYGMWWSSEVSPSMDRPPGTVCRLHCEHQSCHRTPLHVHWRHEDATVLDRPAPLRHFYTIPVPNTNALTYLLTQLVIYYSNTQNYPFWYYLHFRSSSPVIFLSCEIANRPVCSCKVLVSLVTVQKQELCNDDVWCPTSWNSLPDSLKDINLTLQTFKRHLRTFLFSTY